MVYANEKTVLCWFNGYNAFVQAVGRQKLPNRIKDRKSSFQKITDGLEQTVVSQNKADTIQKPEDYDVVSIIYKDGSKDIFYLFHQDDKWYLETPEGGVYQSADFITGIKFESKLSGGIHMKKEYSKFLLRLPTIITVLALMVFVGIPVSIYWHDRFVFANPNNAIMENYWMISLPKKSEMKQIVKENTPYGPHGEATHHSVYQVKRSKIQHTFRADPSTEIEDACKEYCDKLETRSSYIPDFSQKYSWFLREQNQDTLILLYFTDSEEFHIFEVFF